MLKLAALDSEDLEVISAHLQDAVLKISDISYVPGKKQFALVANRYAWEAGERQRRRAGLHFDRVLAVRTQGLRQRDKEAVASLLAITFEKCKAPSGYINLAFSGGGTIRLDVECIEASLKDLGPSWAARHQPSHETGGKET